MKKFILYIGILFFISLSYQSQAQKKYKTIVTQLYSNVGTGPNVAPAVILYNKASKAAVGALNVGTTIYNTKPDSAQLLLTVIGFSGSTNCTGSCTSNHNITECGVSGISACANPCGAGGSLFSIEMFGTPSLSVSGGSGDGGGFCASDVIQLSSDACPGLAGPLVWEYQTGGTWTQLAETTTNSVNTSFASISGATLGLPINFRVRYKNHIDLGYSAIIDIRVNTDPPTVLGVSGTNTSCNGVNDGTFTIQGVSGFAPQYSYDLQIFNGGNWVGLGGIDIPSFPYTITGREPGTYRVIITNSTTSGGAASCAPDTSANVTISYPPAFTATAPTCSNCSSSSPNFVTQCVGGTANLSFALSGGTKNYKYSYSGGALTSTVSGTTGSNTFSVSLPAGVYNFTFTDQNDCTPQPFTVTITDPAPLTATVNLATKDHGSNTSCAGVNDGQIQVTPSGGQSGPYTVVLRKGGITVDIKTGVSGSTTFSNLIANANDYSIIMTEGSCTSNSIPVATLSAPPAISATLDNYVSPTCATAATNDTDNGEVRVTPQGGVGPFTIHLKNGPTTVAISPSIAKGNAHTFNVLGVGITYTVEIIETGLDGCGAANPYTTTTTPLVDRVAPTITVTTLLKANGLNLSCAGGNDGVIEVTPTNGTNITNFDVALLGSSTQTNITAGTKVTFNALTAGSYTVEVTEKNTGCTFSQSVTLTAPPALTAFIERGPIQTNGIAHISCNGGSDGSLVVRPQGGGNGAPYNITVQNLTGYSASQTGVAVNDTRTFNGLPAGTYTVIIADVNGCTTSFTQETTTGNAALELTEPAPITIGSFTTRNVTCLGDTDGTVNVIINGGNLFDPTGVTLIDINNGATTFPNPTQLSVNEFRWTNLAPGNYRVTVTDSKGCTLQDVTPWPNSSFNINQPAQALGLNVDTNSPVACNGQNDGFVTVSGVGGWGNYVYSSDGTNFSAAPSATFTFSNLTAGNYQFWVRDDLGCVHSINVTVTEPPVLVPQIVSTTNVSCNGDNDGSVTLGATGGQGAGSYTYSTQPASGFSANPTFGTLTAGDYTFYVRTNDNCTEAINVTITEPPVLTASIEATKIRNITCNGANDGAVTANIAGGTAPYKISANGEAFVAGDFIEGLVPGNNNVRVEDAQGCFVLLNVNITEPTLLQINLVQKKETACLQAKGLAEVVAVGGTAPYSYQWTDHQNNPLGTSPLLNNLNAGSYNVQVTDANGCIANLPVGIATLGAPQIQVTASTVASCEAAADGTATIQITSGVTPVTVRWDNGQSTLTATGLTPGIHLVTLTDADGCATTEEVTIGQAPAMVIQATSKVNPSCFGGCDGSINVQVTNGTAPYTYAWNVAGKTGSSINGLCAGLYAVTVTDAKGCTQTQSFQLTSPTPLALQITENKAPACFGGCDGRLTVTPSGGTAPYTYAWSHDATQTTAAVDGLCTGVYSVTITDAKGCQITQSIRLNEPRELVLNLNTSATNDPLCNDAATGKLAVAVSGGVAPYAYRWDAPGQANVGRSNTLANVGAGAYTFTVTDANGCTKTATYVLTNPAPLSVQLVQSASKDPNCNQGCDGVLRVQAQGGTAPYTYRWNDNQASNQATGLCAGQHTVTVTDAKGCTFSATYELFDPAPVAIDLPQTVTLCPGQIYTANAGNAGAAYEWRFQGSFLSNSRVLNLSNPGTYSLTVTNFKGCIATATMEIIASSDALKADLTMLDKGVVGDTIAAINLTFPVPERVDWKVSGTSGQRELLNYPGTFEQPIIFKESGIYTVTLFVYSGNCQDSISQTIEIFETEQEAEGGRRNLGYQPKVKVEQFKAYPNPTFGDFKVSVKLSKVGDATVKIRSPQTSRIVSEQTKTGEKDYSFEFSLQKVPYGVYFVIIETEGSTQTLKILLH